MLQKYETAGGPIRRADAAVLFRSSPLPQEASALMTYLDKAFSPFFALFCPFLSLKQA
jgi:hypothetical protein